MKTKYEVCQSKIVENIMKKFEKDTLKNRSNKTIESKKQAIAIALSISDKECEKKFGKDDYKKIEERFQKNIYMDVKNSRLSDKKLSYSTVKNGIKLIEYYRSKKKYIKANNILNSIIVKILFEIKKGEKVSDLIINDLLMYMK